MPGACRWGSNVITNGRPKQHHQACPVVPAGGFFVLMAWFCFSAHGAIPHLKPSLPGEASQQRMVEPHPLRASVACCYRGPAPLPKHSSPEPCPEAALLFLPCPGFALPTPALPDSLAVLPLLSWGASVPTPWG